MAGGPEVLEYFLRCHICSKTFTDPVSLECNHSFCKICLCEFWDQDENRTCPVCLMPASKDEPQVNKSLKGFADVFAGRIQEHNNSEFKPEVMCRAHMQGTHIHIGNHMWICKSENDKLVCEGCEGIKKHAGHSLVLLQDAVEDIKRSIGLDLCPMKQQARECKEMEDTYVQIEKHLKVQQEMVEKKIKEEFEEIRQALQKEEEARLTAIREEAERKRKIVERELKIIRGQIHVLTKSICHVECDLKQDIGLFYSDRKYTMEKVKCRLQNPHMVSGVLIDVPKHIGNLKFKVWKRMIDTVKYFPVILDPNTADGWLQVSDDMTTVWEVKPKLNVPDNPERFTKYIYVLGSEGYTSGKHCWDVDVANRKKWSLGVAKESIERKGETFLETRFGFWTIWVDDYKCTVGGLNIELEKKPERVRVQLDYEKGELYFFDAPEMTYIHAYRTTFTDKLYPFFSTETDDSESGLSIRPFTLSLIARP